jgi:TolA-binding protein
MRRILSGLLPCLLLLACEGRRGDNSKTMATIQGERLTLDQFSLLLNTLPDEKRKEVLSQPEAKRRQFETLLKQRLYSLAAQTEGYGKNEVLKNRLKMIDQRIVSQFYYQSFLGERLGLTKNDLESHYQQHPTSFKGDSGKPLPFESIMTRVADSLVVSKANLDSFFQTTKDKYIEKAYCELSLIQVKDKKTAATVFDQLEKGMPFKEAVQKYSIHTNKSSEGRAGRVNPGAPMWEIGLEINQDSLFFNEASKMGTGKYSKPFKKDSTWLIVKSDTCVPQITPTLAGVRAQVAAEYLANYRNSLNDSALSRLKAKYQVQVKNLRKTPDAAALQAFYEKNRDSYSSPETYGIYHLETSKPSMVSVKIKAVKELGDFKKLAAQYSENAWTKPDSGKSGAIKRDHCLPYGIGMLPNLWAAFDTLKSGAVAGPYLNPESGKSHWFFLTEKASRKPKSFDRVKGLVVKEYQDEAIAQIKPTDTLATWEKRTLLESDVIALRQEIPPNMQERYTREQLVDYLLTWELTTKDAETTGLNKELRLIALRLENIDNYWSSIYQDSVLAKTYAEDTLTLKGEFAKNKAVLTKDMSRNDWQPLVRDIAALRTLNDSDFKLEYTTYPERYRRDSVTLSLEESRYDIFQNLKAVAYARAETALFEKLKTRFQVQIVDPDLNAPKITKAEEAYKKAQDMHYDRKLDEALALYQQLRDQFPGNTSLQDSICFGVAQIYIEQERYQQAMAEYRRVSYLYPNSPNEYKAQFMVGFIQSEHLKNDSAAVQTFLAMLKKYPSTDLSDDADWMVRNIRSGGKLMPVLEGDSGWVEPDSAKTSQPAKSNGKDSAASTPVKPAAQDSAAKK